MRPEGRERARGRGCGYFFRTLLESALVDVSKWPPQMRAHATAHPETAATDDSDDDDEKNRGSMSGAGAVGGEVQGHGIILRQTMRVPNKRPAAASTETTVTANASPPVVPVEVRLGRAEAKPEYCGDTLYSYGSGNERYWD